MSLRILLTFLVTAFLFTACQEEITPSAEITATPQPLATWFPLTVGEVPLSAQFAVEQHEQSKGLMDRDKLGADKGMLFVFQRPQRMSFWMRRTRIPLDIGYCTPDGILREIYQMEPFDETSVPSARTDLQFALEMNQGWFAQHGVKPGDKLDMEQVKAALLARGYEPERLGVR